MSRLIRQAGAEVTTARDGEEGLSYLLTQYFDVLLTDLRMPVMDGFELLNHAMKLPDTKRPHRIIAISGEYEAGALTGHSVQFLAKPFNLDSLLDMLGGKPN
ncbi:response regulator [soil metagenome]